MDGGGDIFTKCYRPSTRMTVALSGSAYRTVRCGRVGDKSLLADSCYTSTLNRGSPLCCGLLGYRVRSRVAAASRISANNEYQLMKMMFQMMTVWFLRQ